MANTSILAVHFSVALIAIISVLMYSAFIYGAIICVKNLVAC